MSENPDTWGVRVGDAAPRGVISGMGRKLNPPEATQGLFSEERNERLQHSSLTLNGPPFQVLPDHADGLLAVLLTVPS